MENERIIFISNHALGKEYYQPQKPLVGHSMTSTLYEKQRLREVRQELSNLVTEGRERERANE